MSETPRNPETNGSSPGGEELDALLRQWHRQNAERAAAGRESLMARLRAESEKPAGVGMGAQMKLDLPPLIDDELQESLRAREKPEERRSGVVVVLRRLSMHRTWTAAAAAIILAATLPLIMLNRGGGPSPINLGAPGETAAIRTASFEGYIMCPEGGRLEAKDRDGNLLGPCELRHTDVVADVSGFLTRVTLTQKYHNPHSDKIEALYTFPLSERAAVDRMTMTIGNRVIEGQVKEKAEARRIYEQAKAEGRVASLLEQERPNIFTQTIANIEPGATIDITISYVETTKQVGGVFEFDFPTTITPRFIPGSPMTGDTPPPQPRPNIHRRHGLVLLAPATISEMRAGDTVARGPLSEAQLSTMLRHAVPIRGTSPSANIWYTFRAAYQDGSAEFGTLYTDGLGTVNGRWFMIPDHAIAGHQERADATGAGAQPGAPFSPDTDRVPDASKITPMPVKPGTRAGHDISITVNIDTGGPALGLVASPLHEINTSKTGSRATVTLRNNADIPNRDFVLKWRQESRDVEPAVFTSTTDRGNFFAVQLIPPPAMNDDEVAAMAVPREMVFVLDVSGSMKGRPIEKAKEVLDRALSTLRPNDTFNVIRFQDSLVTLWGAPRRATPENLVEARAFYSLTIGGGGTQMLPAIQAAYRAGGADAPAPQAGLTPLQLANLPADRRDVTVDVPFDQLRQVQLDPAIQRFNPPVETWKLRVSPTVEIETLPLVKIPAKQNVAQGSFYRLSGVWETTGGERILAVRSASIETRPIAGPFRMIVFLTDGIIGNDNEVIAEIQAQQGRAAIFPFAIGNGPNRYLLDSMARFGRGEVEYVYETTNADEVINRFSQRIQTPVLTNIKVEFSPNLNVLDVMTALGGGGGSVSTIDAIPDLFDVKPLTIVGRYNQPASGTVNISGMTAAGPYRRVISLDLPAPLAPEQLKALEDVRLGLARAEEAPPVVRQAMGKDSIGTLWARAKVEAVTGQDLRGVLAGNVNPSVRSQIITLGETFNLVTQYTSFVAVDRLRVTIAGKPRLVHIPIELTAGTDFSGFFGGQSAPVSDLDDDMALLSSGAQLTRFTRELNGVDAYAWHSFAVDLQPVVGDSAVGHDPQISLLEDRGGLKQDAAATPGDPTGEATRERERIGLAERARRESKPAAQPLAQDERKYKDAETGSPVRKSLMPSDGERGAKKPAAPVGPRPRSDEGGAGAGAGPGVENRQNRDDSTKDAKKEAAPTGGSSAPESRGAAPAAAPGSAQPGKSEEKNEPAAAKDPSPPPPPSPSPSPLQEPAPAPELMLKKTVEELAARRVHDGENKRVATGLEVLDARVIADPAGATVMTVSPQQGKDATFFGFIKYDAATVPQNHWQVAGVDQAQAAEAGRVLTLYFSNQQPVPAPGAVAELDKVRIDANAASDADRVRTSHEGAEAAKSTDASIPRQRVVLAEHVIIRIGTLVHENKLEQAASLAKALAESLPGVSAATEVNRVLSDAAVTPEERTRIIDEQAAEAKKRLEAILRDTKLRQRLDPELLAFARGEGYPTALGASYDGPWPTSATSIDGGVLLSILVTDANDATRDALSKAGLRVESADKETRVIIGVAPLGKLADIAVVDGVRKVEATR